jgi:hypothetical protein
MDPKNISLLAPYIFWGGCLGALVASSLAVSRSLAMVNDLVSGVISAGLITIIGSVFFLILGITCTIVSPTESYWLGCGEAWVLLTLIPSLLIIMKLFNFSGSPKTFKEVASKHINNIGNIHKDGDGDGDGDVHESLDRNAKDNPPKI